MHFEEQEKVPIKRIDSVFEELIDRQNSTRIYLKLDTQGYDWNVLQGLGVYSNQILALQTEVSVIPLYQDSPNYLESIERLNQMQFELVDLIPVCRDEKNMRIIEFDCVMSKVNSI
ncbi:MAG: FkbM family methyltransferase [Xenococcaceae cyanobacterium]